MNPEKRAHHRYLTKRVQLRIPDRVHLHATLRDISEGGVYVETAHPQMVGEQTRVELFPPGWGQPLLLTGKVVRAELKGYAVRLDSPSEKAKAQLSTLVSQVAAELATSQVGSLPEAQQRLALVEAELRDTREKLARVQADAEANRAYLERALAQASAQQRHRVPVAVWAIAGGGGLLAGVVLTTVLSVARSSPPPMPREDITATRPPSVKSLEDTGPRRPTPLPMAAIFNGESAEADAGTERDAGAAAAPKKLVGGQVPALPRPAAPTANTGTLNFLANAPAEVLVNFKKVGTTPLKGYALKPGSYRVQFVCAGGAPSTPRVVVVALFTDTDVEHRCE